MPLIFLMFQVLPAKVPTSCLGAGADISILWGGEGAEERERERDGTCSSGDSGTWNKEHTSDWNRSGILGRSTREGNVPSLQVASLTPSQSHLTSEGKTGGKKARKAVEQKRQSVKEIKREEETNVWNECYRQGSTSSRRTITLAGNTPPLPLSHEGKLLSAHEEQGSAVEMTY